MRVSDGEPSNDELLAEMATQLSALQLENETLTKLLRDAPSGVDGTLQLALSTVAKQSKEIVVLRERNDSLLDEKNAAIRAASSAEKRARKAGA